MIESIGAFPEEYKAYMQIIWMIYLGYTLLVVLTVVQIVSFYLYNGRFHPFAAIIMPDQKCEDESKDLSYWLKTLFFSVERFEAFEMDTHIKEDDKGIKNMEETYCEVEF